MKNEDVILKGIKRGVINAINGKAHAEAGVHFLTTATACPDGDYYAFELGDNGATITSIDYGEYANLYSGTLTGFTFVPGQTYFIKFKSITISAGELICYKNP